MPHPREAIFDVMKVQQQRAEEERIMRQRGMSREAAYAQWTQDNARARSNAR